VVVLDEGEEISDRAIVRDWVPFRPHRAEAVEAFRIGREFAAVINVLAL